MILTINPTHRLKGTISLPASKSYSIRAFVVAACGGASRIISPSNCDDAHVALRVAKTLAKNVSRRGNSWMIKANVNKNSRTTISVGESGTVLRFLLPLISLFNHQARITGEGTLRGRPNKALLQTLRRMGLKIRGRGKMESVPIVLSNGALKGGEVAIDGTVSSQFISSLLITCPLLHNDTIIRIKGKKIVSADYITMTQQILGLAGVKVRQSSPRRFQIKSSQRYKGLKNFTVPSDYGLAAFLMGASALIDSDLNLKGYFNDRLIQADGAILSILRKMGVKFTRTGRAIKIKGPFQIKGGQFSLKDCPDLVPIVAVLSLFAKGRTRLYDIKHVRAKESNRISDLSRELRKVGVKISEGANELIVYPQAEYKSNVTLNPHNDHRLAMAFAVLGLRLGARVRNMECCSKSYPEFVRDIKNIGAHIKKK